MVHIILYQQCAPNPLPDPIDRAPPDPDGGILAKSQRGRSQQLRELASADMAQTEGPVQCPMKMDSARPTFNYECVSCLGVVSYSWVDVGSLRRQVEEAVATASGVEWPRVLGGMYTAYEAQDILGAFHKDYLLLLQVLCLLGGVRDLEGLHREAHKFHRCAVAR